MIAEPESTNARPPSRPVISLIVCSRNDDYLGRARWRLQTGLNLTARAIHELGLEDSVEIILADWGSESPLREDLHLTEEAARLLSVLEVPKAMAERYQRDAPFSEVHALNAAARRARGDYIGRIDQDTILGRGFLKAFFEVHRGERALPVPVDKALMLSNRRGVPYRFAAMCPSPMVVDRFIRLFGRWLPLANPLPESRYYQSYVGIWLLHRDLWFEIGGYDESFIYINWMEVDMILRLETKYTFVNLGRVVDHDIYHLDHIHPLAHWGARGRVRRENPYRDRDNRPEQTFPNGDDWGLMNEALALRPYPLKPGEAAAAATAFAGAQWGAFILQTTLFLGRFLADRAALAFFAVVTAGPNLIMTIVPGLREPLHAYRDIVRGHPLSEWPRRLLDLRRTRRSANGGKNGTA